MNLWSWLSKVQICFLAFLLTVSFNSYSQNSLRDLEDLDSLIVGISTPLYNQEFQKTQTNIQKLELRLPGHPIVDLLYALNLIWKTIPDPNPPEFSTIESYLKSSIDKAEQMIDEDKENTEGNFFLLMAHGLLAQYYGDQRSTFKAVSEAKKAYNSVIKGIALKNDYVEYYFSSGLYNYYREKYPELYPIYKSFVWIFKNGNKEEGINQIQYASRHAVLSRVEASHYMAFIYMRMEGKPYDAMKIIRSLLEQYPNNYYFKMMKLECLDMTNQMSLGYKNLQELLPIEMPYIKMTTRAYEGVYAEKIEKNLRKAMSKYKSALKIGESMEDYGNHPKSVAMVGLGRISHANNDMDMAISYFKKAKKLASSPYIKNEAETYLDSH
jgi:tetratricopeptide (TPR) repeat protein